MGENYLQQQGDVTEARKQLDSLQPILLLTNQSLSPDWNW